MGDNLNMLGLLIIAIGLIFLIYSLMCKNKVNIYNKSYTNTIIDRQKFLLVQLYVSVINSVCLIVFGALVIIVELPYIYVVAYPLLFHLINYATPLIGRAKQYLKY